jgi:hypothetical protein
MAHRGSCIGRLIALGFALSLVSPAAPALHLKEGDTLLLEAKNFVQVGASGFGDQVVVTVTLGEDGRTGSELIRLELFENTAVAGELFFTNDYPPSGPSFPGDQFGVGVVIPVAWRDFQGLIRLTALVGEFDIDNVLFRLFDGGVDYQQSLELQAVPEPTGLAIIALAALAGWGVASGRRRALRRSSLK